MSLSTLPLMALSFLYLISERFDILIVIKKNKKNKTKLRHSWFFKMFLVKDPTIMVFFLLVIFIKMLICYVQMCLKRQFKWAIPIQMMYSNSNGLFQLKWTISMGHKEFL